MLSPITSAVIPSYPVVQKSLAPSLLSLPVEVRAEIENHLQPWDQESFFEALTTVTRNGDAVDSPVLKLHLLQQRIRSKDQQTLASSDASLRAFALNQLQRLWEAGQLDQVVEKPALFELLRLVNDPAIFGFLNQRIELEPELKQKLLHWVERSKTDEVQVTAANALTLLVKAGVPLTRQNFEGIRVPGADLSHGVFDHTEFKNADLREVNWSRAWLREANLDGADLAGVALGERPVLKMKQPALACCYSPDGRWLAVVEGNDIQLYEAKALQWEHTYAGHEDQVKSIAFSSDGQWLASGGQDQAVKLWFAAGDRSLAHTYAGHESTVNSVAFSFDGQWLASGSQDKTVKLWFVASDRSLAHTYAGHEEGVNSVALSSDGQWLASGAEDKTMKLWRVSGDRSLVHTYTGYLGGVTSVAFSPDGQWLASGGISAQATVWLVCGDRSLVRTYMKGPQRAKNLVFSPDGQWLAFSGSSRMVKLWSVSSYRTITRQYTSNTGGARSLAFSPDGQWLASGDEDKRVEQRPISNNQSFTLMYPHGGPNPWVRSVAFSPDGQWLASAGGHNEKVKLWSVSGVRSLAHTYTERESGVNSIAFSPDGQWLASGDGYGKKLKLWLVAGDRSLVHTYAERPYYLTSLAFSPDGQWLASAGNSAVELWFVSGDRSLAHTYTVNEIGVNSIAFSPDSQWLASGDFDRTVKLWSVSGNRSLAHTYAGHEEEVNSVAFSSDGQWLASGAEDKTMKLWRVSGDRSLMHTYTGHLGGVRSVAFSPDSQWLASSSEDCTVKLWSVHTGACQATLRSFVRVVNTAVWQTLPDGATMLATGGQDEAVRLWRVSSKDLGQIGQITLEWTSAQTTLTATDARIENARNLSLQNRVLLRQLGASSA